MEHDLILEIGTEEIPARFMTGALGDLEKKASAKLTRERLEFADLRSYGTPRRLALHILQLAEEQGELVEEVKGPPARAAYDDTGKPTKAALGFARSQGVRVEELVVRDMEAGQYVFACKHAPGLRAVDILPRLLSELISDLSFPKTMRWGHGEMRFVRPIRWLVAVYGREVVEFELAGVRSGRVSCGHRFLSRRPVGLLSPSEYTDKLELHHVIVDHRKRREMIWAKINELAGEMGGWVEHDEALLDEVTFLVEFPTVISGTFPEEYLALPHEVLVTPMREHQRYFPVWNERGRLLARFIAITNVAADQAGLVCLGNEKVLRARLADASFFYHEDLKIPLPDRVENLTEIVFQEELGTMLQKVKRLEQLVAFIGHRVGLSGDEVENAIRAARLCKADLTTSMVCEFPELQGIMGAYYATAVGEEGGVCQAIRQHYLPRFAGDALPESNVGVTVALADRLDTLIGCFAVGIEPTGSQDPYALRRSAIGVLRILLERRIDLDLALVISECYRRYEEQIVPKLSLEEVKENLSDFFRKRLRNIMEEDGISYDVADAAISVSWTNPRDVVARAVSLLEFANSPDFASLLVVFTRAANLSKGIEAGEVREKLLVEPAEQELQRAFQQARREGDPLLRERNYLKFWEAVVCLRQSLDRFFDEVLVMSEDVSLRQNRLYLLKSIADYLRQVADLAAVAREKVTGPAGKN